ncbi:hypothetical protein ACFFX0_29435 [Citricoccus parietis]|uniref:Uncharacterized protein n=1 Tax=Citricoccus parietis TaxID=592307 RepID=A0ABV5G823_9MICC
MDGSDNGSSHHPQRTARGRRGEDLRALIMRSFHNGHPLHRRGQNVPECTLVPDV